MAVLFFHIKNGFFIFVSIFLFSCQSAPKLPPGMQQGYEAINPASIISVPVFLVPDLKNYFYIDNAIYKLDKIKILFQDKVISSFKNQPHINGYSFQTVENALIKSNSTVLDRMKKTIEKVSNNFSSTDLSIRSSMTARCIAHKNFIEFYTFCLASNRDWIEELNELSTRVLNSDSALLVFIRQLESHVENNVYSINGSFSVLLVDTNNGNLIWGKDISHISKQTAENKFFPSWKTLIDEIFKEDFWTDFPGRIKNK